jgi:hypothetical protein
METGMWENDFLVNSLCLREHRLCTRANQDFAGRPTLQSVHFRFCKPEGLPTNSGAIKPSQTPKK